MGLSIPFSIANSNRCLPRETFATAISPCPIPVVFCRLLTAQQTYRMDNGEPKQTHTRARASHSPNLRTRCPVRGNATLAYALLGCLSELGGACEKRTIVAKRTTSARATKRQSSVHSRLHLRVSVGFGALSFLLPKQRYCQVVGSGSTSTRPRESSHRTPQEGLV